MLKVVIKQFILIGIVVSSCYPLITYTPGADQIKTIGRYKLTNIALVINTITASVHFIYDLFPIGFIKSLYYSFSILSFDISIVVAAMFWILFAIDPILVIHENFRYQTIGIRNIIKYNLLSHILPLLFSTMLAVKSGVNKPIKYIVDHTIIYFVYFCALWRLKYKYGVAPYSFMKNYSMLQTFILFLLIIAFSWVCEFILISAVKRIKK